MKTSYLKCLLFIVFAFGYSISFSQEENKNIFQKIQDPDIIVQDASTKFIPRWYCPYIKIMFEVPSKTYIAVGNFSMKPVNIRIIYYRDTGKVLYSQIKTLKAKETYSRIFYDNPFGGEWFEGSIEIQSDSPTIYPSAHYSSGWWIGIPGQHPAPWSINVTADWYRLDR